VQNKANFQGPVMAVTTVLSVACEKRTRIMGREKQSQIPREVSSWKFQVGTPALPASHFTLQTSHFPRNALRRHYKLEALCRTKPNLGKRGYLGKGRVSDTRRGSRTPGIVFGNPCRVVRSVQHGRGSFRCKKGDRHDGVDLRKTFAWKPC
jgi:hypothetical protein